MKYCRWTPAVVSLILAIATYFGPGLHSAPWCDELAFVDSGINFLRTGAWHSEVFYMVNNPMFPITAALAILLFGATHLTVVGVNVFFALLSSLTLLHILRRRNVLQGLAQQLLFVGLFWAGETFAWIATDGRPDTLALWLTVLLLDTILPEADRRCSCFKTLGLAYLLMLCAAYTLPLCCLISAAGILRKDLRRAAFLRTLSVVFGGALAWFSIAAFYAYHHEFIRFIGYYAAFNSITGQATDSLFRRIVNGYGYDRLALALTILTLIPILIRNNLRVAIPYGVIVLGIPILMTLCGRYQPYYSWILSVAAATFAAAMLPRAFPKAALPLVILSLTPTALRTIQAIGKPTQSEHARRAAAFVAENAQWLQDDKTVLVADDTMGDVSLYYPLIQAKANLWFRGKIALTELSDRQKFEMGLGQYVQDADKRKRMLDTVFRFQRLMPFLPDHGVVLFTSEQNRAEVEPLLRQHKQLTFVTTNQDLSLYTFK